MVKEEQSEAKKKGLTRNGKILLGVVGGIFIIFFIATLTNTETAPVANDSSSQVNNTPTPTPATTTHSC